MKKAITLGVLMLLGTSLVLGISPYLKIAESNDNMNEAQAKVLSVLQDRGYEILGQYKPGGNPDLYVVVFSDDKLSNLCNKSNDRGMLAAAMKIGFQRKDGKTTISMVNPEYLFYAYFRKKMEETSFKTSVLSVSSGIIKDLQGVGNLMEPFGGDQSVKDLVKFRYMVGMPNYDDPVKLAEFESFTQGISTIRKNLSAGKGNTVKVYEMVDESTNTAVFGVGLLHPEEGESHFLPIIGESHVAAMPYEIIVVNNKATMLHGRFRFALHWPELTMKTFTKIMSSPGDVEDAMKTLVE